MGMACMWWGSDQASCDGCAHLGAGAVSAEGTAGADGGEWGKMACRSKRATQPVPAEPCTFLPCIHFSISPLKACTNNNTARSPLESLA